jgi:hypothetical protein
MIKHFVKNLKNYRKNLSYKMRNFYPIKKSHDFINFILMGIFYRQLYKGLVFLFTMFYLKFILKYKSFTYYKISKKCNEEDFHGNAAFSYCSATTKSGEKVFLKIANNITTLGKEVKLIKEFYKVSQKDLKCLKIVNSLNSPIINFISTKYIDGVTLGNYVLNNHQKITKEQKIDILKQLKIILEKLNEAEIYGFQTCSTHLDNIMISFNKNKKIQLTLIDFGRYKFFRKKNKEKYIQKNTENIIKIADKIIMVLNIDKQYFKEYFD